MAKFTVALQCIMTAEVTVNVESVSTLEEAKKIALENVPSPSNTLVHTMHRGYIPKVHGTWEFLDDSMEVNEDCTNELNAVPSQSTTTGG